MQVQAGFGTHQSRPGRLQGPWRGAARPGAYRLKGGANPEALRRAGEVVKANADTAYTDIAGIVTDLRRLVASRAASQLTGDGYITRRGLPWNKQLVKRVIERLEELINANG